MLLKHVVSLSPGPSSRTVLQKANYALLSLNTPMYRSPLTPVSFFPMPIDSQLLVLPPAPHPAAKRRRESTSSIRNSKRSCHPIEANATLQATSSPTSAGYTLSGALSPSTKHATKMAHAKRADKSQMKEREEAWMQWCEEHRWEPKDDPGYKQKVRSKEVHRSDGESPIPIPPSSSAPRLPPSSSLAARRHEDVR